MTDPGGTVGEAGAASVELALARFGADHRAALDAILRAVRHRLPGLTDDVRAVVGWATVDLERAVRDAGVRSSADAAGCPDALLGARGLTCGDDLLLLEPTTEGRLAAALARHGEGPIALYLLAGPRVPVSLPPGEHAATGTDAPLRLRAGRSALGPGILAEASRSGPFIVVVRDDEPVPCRA